MLKYAEEQIAAAMEAVSRGKCVATAAKFQNNFNIANQNSSDESECVNEVFDKPKLEEKITPDIPLQEEYKENNLLVGSVSN